MNPFLGAQSYDEQDRLDQLAADEQREKEARIYFASLVDGKLVVEDDDNWCTAIDDARTELAEWCKECRDAGEEEKTRTICIVQGLTPPVVLRWGSERLEP